MTSDVSSPPVQRDPVTAALEEALVVGRLNAAARAFLAGRAPSLLATRRAAEAEEIVSVAKLRALQRRHQFDPGRDVVNRTGRRRPRTARALSPRAWG
jgi:hypothetical protein